MTKSISIKQLMERDISSDNKIHRLFQITSQKNESNATIQYIQSSEKYMAYPILDLENDKYTFKLFSFTIADQDFNEQYLKMIGYIITSKKTNELTDSLELVFEPDSDIKSLDMTKIIKTNCNGKFKILFNDTIIESYDKYIGHEESIYLLTNILNEKIIYKLS